MYMDNIIELQQRKISLFVQAVGFVFFGILFYISWQFYLERMLYVDDAFYFFQLLQADRPITALNRYGDFIPQLLPYVAYKMESPLHTVLICYSVSFILLHYLIFLIVTLILKNNGAGIAIMLASCLSYYHAFYTPLVQLNESIIAAIMLWALIHPETPYVSNKEKILSALGAFATIFYMSFLHPLGIVAIMFVFGIELIGAKRFKDRYLWITIIAGAGWFLFKIMILYRTQYDKDHIIPLSVMWQQLPNWRHWPSTQYLDNLTYLHFRSLKWLGIIIVALCLRKGIAFFLFVLAFIIAFSLLYFITLYKGESALYYEDYYCYYGFFIGLLFVFLFYHPRRKNLVILLSLPLLYIGVHRIYIARTLLTDRVGYLNRLIDQAEKTKERKCIVDEKCYPYDYAMAPWNVAFETLIYSSLRGADSTVTIFVKKPDFAGLCDTVIKHPKLNVMLGAHFAPLWYTSNDIPEEYFKLPSTGYTYLTHSQDDTTFHENMFSADNVKITPLVLSAEVIKNNNFIVIPLQITNTSGKTIPSIPGEKNAVYLGYKEYDSKGNLLYTKENEPLETDVSGEAKEGLIIYYYGLQKGVYYFEPDLMTAGKRSWNIPTQRIAIKVD